MDNVEWLRPARGVTYDVLVGGPEDGVPVLLVHGNCSSAEFWLPLMRRLPDGIRVVAPHLRGYGRSEAVTSANRADTVDVLSKRAGKTEMASRT